MLVAVWKILWVWATWEGQRDETLGGGTHGDTHKMLGLWLKSFPLTSLLLGLVTPTPDFIDAAALLHPPTTTPGIIHDTTLTPYITYDPQLLP